MGESGPADGDPTERSRDDRDGRAERDGPISPHADRIDALADRARADRAAFEPPADPPDPERALGYLREGAGQAIAVYVDAHVEGHDRFAPAEYEALEGAMNDWLALYARCHGAAVEPDCTLRTAAELLLETRDLRDVARALTHVPGDEPA